MREAKGDIFKAEADAVCITTNGFTKANGECVMGRGCAKAAAQQVPGLPAILGKLIQEHGNRVLRLWEQNGVALLSFPVKPVSREWRHPESVVAHMRSKFGPGSTVPGWACVASLDIIVASAHQLADMASNQGWQNIVLPRPGCGAGELEWYTVKPFLEGILDDRFTCMTF